MWATSQKRNILCSHGEAIPSTLAIDAPPIPIRVKKIKFMNVKPLINNTILDKGVRSCFLILLLLLLS